MGKNVTADVELTGTDKANYELTSASASTTATISKRSVTASITAADKTYDGTDDAQVTSCSLEAEPQTTASSHPTTSTARPATATSPTPMPAWART